MFAENRIFHKTAVLQPYFPRFQDNTACNTFWQIQAFLLLTRHLEIISLIFEFKNAENTLNEIKQEKIANKKELEDVRVILTDLLIMNTVIFVKKILTFC